MAPPKGNKFGLKLKDPDVRQEAYKQYCEWISNGCSKESFVFEHPTLSVCFKTMERYIKENPYEFPPIHKEIAESKSLCHWEELGKRMMLGQMRGCQPAIYQMFMRNKFGWDKEDRETVYKHETDMDKILNKWEQDGSKPETARQPESLERKD